VGFYKVKGIVSSNAIELELSKSIKIYPIVNVNRVWLYKLQVKGQKKILPKLLIIKGQEEFKVEEILNKRTIRGKKKFLVRWKGYMAKEDTWENRENLENAKELVEEFKKKYGELRRQELEKKRRNLVENYQGSSQQNCYIAGEKRGTKEKGKRGGTRTGIDGKIPWDEET